MKPSSAPLHNRVLEHNKTHIYHYSDLVEGARYTIEMALPPAAFRQPIVYAPRSVDIFTLTIKCNEPCNNSCIFDEVWVCL